MLATLDDYGTSYYYRGAVENNYVEFAGKCWRIVRITGDGSIKLVLYNDNYTTPKSATPCSVNNSAAAFARYTESTYTTAFNPSYNSNSYIGFMYGNPTGSDYASVHANSTPSTILQSLKNWYNANNLTAYASYLADTIWCNDKSTSGTGFGSTNSYYGAYNRLYSTSTATPCLICPNDKNGGNLSRFTVNDTEYGNRALANVEGYPAGLGLLTADEVAFAGGAFGTVNSSYYLNKNASSNQWWTLSPYYFAGSFAVVWIVGSTGSLTSGIVSNSNALRPAISLKSTVLVTGNSDGSSGNPYKVN